MLPYYIHLGMTPGDFWDGDSTLTIAYREADRMRKDQINEQLWLQGRYIYDAFLAVSPALVAFGKAKPLDYNKEPYPITAKQVQEQRERKARQKQSEMKAKFEAFASNFNKSKEKGENEVAERNG